MFLFKKKPRPDRPLSWREHYEKNIASYKEILTWDIFRNWDQIKDPSDIGIEVRLAIEVLFAEGDTGLAIAFAERTVARIKRAFEENLFERCSKESSYVNILLCESTARISWAYAKAILEGRLDTTLLMRAVGDFREGIKPEYVDSYDDIVEHDLLEAVVICLICGAREESKYFYGLVLKKNRKYNKYFFECIRAIMESPADSPDLHLLTSYIKQSSYPSFPNYFQGHFYAKSIVHQFELGMLYAILAGIVTVDYFDIDAVVKAVRA